MRILIIGAAEIQKAAAARLRRLDETAKIIVIDEAGDSRETALLRSKYRVDLRPFTRFISADMGYSNVATLEDTLTRHIYQEEFDKIMNIEPNPATAASFNSHAIALKSRFDADIAAHLASKKQNLDNVRTAKLSLGDMGRHAADEIYGRAVQPEKSMELQVADVSGLRLAIFGQTENNLNSLQMPYMYSILPITDGFIKLIYDDNGNILGFTALGQSQHVENYADIMTTLLKMNGNIQNMISLELCGNKNPLPTLGKIAQNVVEKRLFMAYADEIKQTIPQEMTLLDVRHQLEFMDYRIDGSINIPLESLRDSIYRLERTKEIITICSDGKESYLAARILMGHGFKIRHLTGGLAYARPIITPPQFYPQEVK